MSDVIDFPNNQQDATKAMFGPRLSGTSLIIDGRLIPGIAVFERGKEIEFVLDGRFSYSFPRETALQAATFAVQCLAIGQGYSHIGAPNKDKPFAPEMLGTSTLPAS